MLTTRTTSPYFSSNKAIAPEAKASSFDIFLMTTGHPSKTIWFTFSSISFNNSAEIFSKWVKSNLKSLSST